MLPSSESHSLENSSSSHFLVPPDLTGQITQFDNQYCAAGGFGDVYRCQHHSECGVKEVAVKTFRFEFTVEEEDMNGRPNRMIRRELGIWKRLSHPNIVPFLGTVSGFGRFGNASLVSSWMPNGTLQDFLLKYNDKLTVAHRLQFMLGIANGLQYCMYSAHPTRLRQTRMRTVHSLSIVHGDLTCTNVLLDEKHNARLTDFGYASLVGEIPEALAYLQASTLRPGAVRWAAPEYFFSNPEEMVHCTTKSDIYSFGNIALQVLSGELPWSEFRRDVVIVLHLAKGHKPRRPQSHPIDDQYWDFIQHCWSPVEERPSAEHLVSSILDFLRSHLHPQHFCRLQASSEKSNPQSTLSGPLLSPPNIEQFSPDVPCTFEKLHSVAPNRQHDQSSTIGGLSPPRTVQCPPQLIPDGNLSTPPLTPRELRTYSGSKDGATSQVSRFQYTPENYDQNGPVVNPDTSLTDSGFPKRPPPVHNKSGAISPPFFNTSSIGQDQLSIYPYLYPPSQEYSTHHHYHSQRTTALGRDDREAASGSRDESGGIWSFLSSPFRRSASAQKVPTVGAHISQQQQPPKRLPSMHVQRSYASLSSDYTPGTTFSLANPSSQICDREGVGSFTASPNSAGDVLPDPVVELLSDEACRLPSLMQERSLMSKASSGSRDGGGATRSLLSSYRPSPYPSPSAGPRIHHEDLPDLAFIAPQLSAARSDSPQHNDGGLTPVYSGTVTSECSAGASHRRRKQGANYLCSVPGCGSTFTAIFNLKAHMKSHNMERSFQCKWPGCGMGFFRQHDLKRHERLHSKYRPSTCGGCNKTFAHMDALNRHLCSEGGAECQRISDASKDSEGPLVPMAEEMGWPGMSDLIPDHVDSSLLPQVTSMPISSDAH